MWSFFNPCKVIEKLNRQVANDVLMIHVHIVLIIFYDVAVYYVVDFSQ